MTADLRDAARLLAAALLGTLALAAGASDQGVTLVYGGGGEGKVVFDGLLHARKGFTCNDCHKSFAPTGARLFDTHRRALIDKAAHKSGTQCFACHDGKTASKDCDGCHRENTAGNAAAAGPPTVRLHGAASAVDSLVAPNKAAVEKATGFVLSIDKSNAGKGLIDLADGKCDAALASAGLETIVAAAKAAGREVDVAKLRMAVIASDQVVFVVHPSNAVRQLTADQLRDIHTGKIANWKEVGGADLPIQVVTDTASSATRGLVKQAVLKGAEYVATAKAVKVETISDEVAALPGGIGGLGAGFVKAGKVAQLNTQKVERPLGLITVGEPDAKVARVIEALKAAVAAR